MKKQIILIIIPILIIVFIISAIIWQNQNKQKELQIYNAEYQKYLDKTIYGTDLATLINKAIYNNEKNEVSKDEKGVYKNNGQDSISIEINMITNIEENKTTTYTMENIEKVGIINFITNFSLTTFKSSNVEYHKDSGKISKITFEQLESISY